MRKEIFRNKYLVIFYELEKNRFIQHWINSPETDELFKEIMLDFISLNAKYQPKQVLVLQQNFTLNLSFNTQIWVEENISKKGKSYGNEKLAFVLGKNVLAHLNIVDGFVETKSSMNPKHFASEKEALKWLDESLEPNKQKDNIEVVYNGVDDNGDFIIQVKGDPKDIEKAMYLFKPLDNENKFFKSNINKFNKLTKREKQILKLYTKGITTREISKKLFLSIHTIQTHRRNIKNKLDINSFFETVKFATTFKLGD